jgi:hypothetical protein
MIGKNPERWLDRQSEVEVSFVEEEGKGSARRRLPRVPVGIVIVVVRASYRISSEELPRSLRLKRCPFAGRYRFASPDGFQANSGAGLWPAKRCEASVAGQRQVRGAQIVAAQADVREV